MVRIERLLRLMRMEGSVGERIGTGVIIAAGFIIGIYIGRLILSI